MNLPIHHIGYLTKNLQKSIDSFRNLGYQTEGGITHDQLRKIDICFLRKDGYRIELVSPYGEDSVVSGLMKTHKNMPYVRLFPDAVFPVLGRAGADLPCLRGDCLAGQAS